MLQFLLTLIAKLKASVVNVVDNLTSTSATDALSANQGKVLNDNIGTLSSLTTSTKTSAVDAINEVNTKALFPWSSDGRGQNIKMFSDTGSNFFVLRLDQNDAGTNYMQAVFFGNTKQIQISKGVNGTETLMATFTGT